MFTRALFLLCLASLTGCAPPVTTTTSAGVTGTTDTGPLAKIGAMTVLDLQDADKIAVARKDKVAHACFPALLVWIQSLPGTSTTMTVSGAVSAFELARTTRLGLTSGGIPDDVKIGCGGLLIDEQTLLVKLGAMAATAVPLP